MRDHYDYLPPLESSIPVLLGQRVKISFINKEKIGVITGISDHSSVPTHKLKAAIEIIDETPLLSAEALAFLQWTSSYYQCPLSEILSLALPVKLRQGQSVSRDALPFVSIEQNIFSPHTLNKEQHHAVCAIIEALDTFKPFLLYGITGSGKTEVYLQSIAQVLKQQKQVLVLVPEIGLTPQLLKRFQSRFDTPVYAYHSGLTDKQRYQTWLAAHHGKTSIVIGTRSAVFLSFSALGLIVIDEEHDASLKQQEYPYYSARDLAIVRAQRHKIPIVLGSATPSLESLYNAQQGKYQLFQLTERAGEAQLPKINVVDLKTQVLKKQQKKQGLTPHLLDRIKHHLSQGNQILLFINPRYYAPVMFCPQCRWTAKCQHCDAHITLHRELIYNAIIVIRNIRY